MDTRDKCNDPRGPGPPVPPTTGPALKIDRDVAGTRLIGAQEDESNQAAGALAGEPLGRPGEVAERAGETGHAADPPAGEP